MGRRLPLYFLILQIVFALSVGWAQEQKMGLELEWVFNTSAQFPGLSFGAGHLCSPTVWDIDSDGVNEVLWGTRRGDSKRLWCIEGHGAFQWAYPPMDEDGLPGDPTTKVSIVDLEGDGDYELAISGRGGRLHVINPDGSVRWTWDEPTKQNLHGAPQALDVDGDGFIEFFISTNNATVHRVNHEGKLIWTSEKVESGGYSHPTLCDIDRDGRIEVLWNPYHGNVYCLDSESGKTLWVFETRANPPLAVIDVNRDGEYEVVVWTEAGDSAVIIISFYGTEIARWTHPREGANLRICQAIGDVDDDGSMDIALMSGDAVFVVDIGKVAPTTKWEVNFSQWSVDGILPEGAQANHWGSYQLIADIDGDDHQEILWLAPFPVVTDGATGRLEGYYVNEHIARNRRQESGGWWGDVDNDGISEWICELNGRSHPQTQLYCFTMDGRFPARAYWPEYYHCAYPADYQKSQDWLLSKGAYSNSMWFPLQETSIIGSLSIFIVISIRRLLMKTHYIS